MPEIKNQKSTTLHLSDDIYELLCITSFYIDATTSIAAEPEEIDGYTVRGMELIGMNIKQRMYNLKALADQIHIAPKES